MIKLQNESRDYYTKKERKSKYKKKKGGYDMKFLNGIGVIHSLQRLLDEGEAGVRVLTDAGIECIQLNNWDPSLCTRENADRVLKLLDGKVRISSFWGGWTGPAVWDFVDGPVTLGLVPIAYQAQRIADLKKEADFVHMLGVHDMATHVGFVPEQPTYPGYRELVCAVRTVAAYCKKLELSFNFETGQETPVTLMRLFSDVGADNLGINLDPANLILYGRGNPVDALDIYGDKIRGIHVKDGDYPKGDFHKLGTERVVGEGSVNFPVFLPKLLKNGYRGDLYIEREITGEQQLMDIQKTVVYIKDLMQKTEQEA